MIPDIQHRINRFHLVEEWLLVWLEKQISIKLEDIPAAGAICTSMFDHVHEFPE